MLTQPLPQQLVGSLLLGFGESGRGWVDNARTGGGGLQTVMVLYLLVEGFHLADARKHCFDRKSAIVCCVDDGHAYSLTTIVHGNGAMPRAAAPRNTLREIPAVAGRRNAAAAAVPPFRTIDVTIGGYRSSPRQTPVSCPPRRITSTHRHFVEPHTP